MPKASWENLDSFLVPEHQGGFAIASKITDKLGGERIVWGIFDDPYLNAQLGEYEVDTSSPRFTCKESDVFGIDRGDYWQRLNSITLAPEGEPLNIMSSPQSDGNGMAIIVMEP